MERRGRLVMVVVVVWAALAVSGRHHRHLHCRRDYLPEHRRECRKVAASTEEHRRVLEELCVTGWVHVRDHSDFAVFSLQKDVSHKVSWYGGDAGQVVEDKDWAVDELSDLTNNYRWYRRGLPVWPLVNQTLKIKPKLVWPNFAFATPLHHLIKNGQDFEITIKKFFKEMSNGFATPKKFERFIMHQVVKLRAAATNNDCSWLELLVQDSLGYMVESFGKREKSCPQFLFVFTRRRHCQDQKFMKAGNGSLVNALKKCVRVTQIVFGYLPSYI